MSESVEDLATGDRSVGSAPGAPDRDWLAGEIETADRRIRPLVRETPVDRADALAGGEVEVHLKLENIQHTGSFKLRGALNRLLVLDAAERGRGVVTASSGNHGLAVAHAGRALGLSVEVFVPEEASPTKVAAIESSGANIRKWGDDCVVAEAAARRHAAERGAVYVSPYNDPWVIAGQGTVAAELSRQVEPLDALFVSVGGGGLISGMAAFAKAHWPGVEIVACSPEHSPVMHASLAAGRIVDLPSLPTLADGTAGGLEPGAITFELCQQLVDRSVTVGEAAIAAAMHRIVGRHHLLVEGAAGVAVAGFLAESRRWSGRRVGIVLCGANIAPGLLARVLAQTNGEDQGSREGPIP